MTCSTAYVVSEQLAKVNHEYHCVDILAEYSLEVCSRLPSNRKRSIVVHSLVQSLNLLRAPSVRVITPTPAVKEELCTFHDTEYINYLLGGETGAELSEVFGLVDVDALSTSHLICP